MKKPGARRHAGGTIRPAPNGRGFDCYILVDGSRKRSRQPDLNSARRWLDTAVNGATDIPERLTPEQMDDACRAFAALAVAEVGGEGGGAGAEAGMGAAEGFEALAQIGFVECALHGFRCFRLARAAGE